MTFYQWVFNHPTYEHPQADIALAIQNLYNWGHIPEGYEPGTFDELLALLIHHGGDQIDIKAPGLFGEIQAEHYRKTD